MCKIADAVGHINSLDGATDRERKRELSLFNCSGVFEGILAVSVQCRIRFCVACVLCGSSVDV